MVKNGSIAPIIVISFLPFLAVFLIIVSEEVLAPKDLPEHILRLPAPEQIGGPTRGDEKIIYAKEALLFEQTGTYVMRSYLKASRPLSGTISVYMRESDPASDPACKALTVPSQAKSGVWEYTVYACKRGRRDVKIGVAEFANADLAPFCSIELRGREGEPQTSDVTDISKWIGVEWNPLLPHPFTLVFKDFTAPKVFRFPIARHPCASFR
jgi:hypothetical protein